MSDEFVLVTPDVIIVYDCYPWEKFEFYNGEPAYFFKAHSWKVFTRQIDVQREDSPA